MFIQKAPSIVKYHTRSFERHNNELDIGFVVMPCAVLMGVQTVVGEAVPNHPL